MNDCLLGLIPESWPHALVTLTEKSPQPPAHQRQVATLALFSLFQLWLAWFPCDCTFAPDPEGAQCLGRVQQPGVQGPNQVLGSMAAKRSEPALGM